MSSGSRGVVVFDACAAAPTAAAASKPSTTKPVWILMVLPSPPILSVPLPVEKLPPTAYNSYSCLSLRAVAWYKQFLPVVLFRPMGRRSAVRTKETLNGLRDCRALHRHKRPRLRGCVPRGLYPSA